MGATIEPTALGKHTLKNILITVRSKMMYREVVSWMYVKFLSEV